MTVEGAREESERMLSYALSSIGISVEDICREAGDAFDMSLPDERRIPFSPRAKAVLEWTLRETVWLRANNIGPEHVLPGILDQRTRDGRQDAGSDGRLAGGAGGTAVRAARSGVRLAA